MRAWIQVLAVSRRLAAGHFFSAMMGVLAIVAAGSRAGALPADPSWSFGSDQSGAHLVGAHAGDFNGDGYGDLILGWAVASAGDTNDDGIDDVMVSAYNHDDPEEDEGKVFVYLGELVTTDVTDPQTPGDRSAAGGALRIAGPNPFADYTVLRLDLPPREAPTLRLYDARGVRVATVLPMPAGTAAVEYRLSGQDARGRTLPAGCYFGCADRAAIRIVKLP
jgi:hypothetical protein